MAFSNWMARSLFKDRLFRTALASFLFANSALGLHQLINDRDFEENNPVWEESTWGPYSKADRYYPGGYESDHCGFMDASFPDNPSGWQFVWAKLGQDISKRKISEITEFEWALKYKGRWSGFNSIEIIASAENDTLIYLYHSQNAIWLPKETEHTKVIKLQQIENVWKVTTTMLGGEDGDWVSEGLPSDALLKK